MVLGKNICPSSAVIKSNASRRNPKDTAMMM
jgi:hypothetical protein